jgi:transcriptional regulator with XRE-family HTH domain
LTRPCQIGEFDYKIDRLRPAFVRFDVQIRATQAACRLLSRVAPMSDRHTFGPRLRSERERRGISLDTIATATKVSADLWEGLERNDFSRWPSGIFARAFIRDYARAVGLDADEVVDEFCRLFPIGDRRAARLIKAQAELIGHNPALSETMIPETGDRRSIELTAHERSRALAARYASRAVAATIDTSCSLLLSAAIALPLAINFWATAGVIGIVYYGVATVALGKTLGTRTAAALGQRMPAVFAVQDRRRAHA